MTSRFTITESRTSRLKITAEQAAALQVVSSRSASDKAWWGASGRVEDDERGTLQLREAGAGFWDVRAHEFVGLIAAPELELVIEPKVPLDHLIHFLKRSDGVPRHLPQLGASAEQPELWELVVRWFLESAEGLLRRGLSRGYRGHHETLAFVRGRADLATALVNVGRGSIAIPCEFDEFTHDIAQNRVLLRAARGIAGAAALDGTLRRRALRIVQQLDEVSEMRSDDLRAPIAREMRAYRSPLTFARSVIDSLGPVPKPGGSATWTFLIRTPEPFEEAMRTIAAETLGPLGMTVEKKGKQAQGAPIRFNPDIVVSGSLAVADAKYRFFSEEWDRPVLNQVMAFAAAFDAPSALVVALTPDGSHPPSFDVGGIAVRVAAWRLDLGPEAAEARLREVIRAWGEELLAHDPPSVLGQNGPDRIRPLPVPP